MARYRFERVSIAQSAQVSEEVDANGQELVGVYLPAAITGAITLQAVSPIGSTYATFKTITFAANSYIPYTDARGLYRVRINSGSAEAAKRDFVLVFEE